MSKTRVQKWWSKRNLPEELWPDILSRLPVKSLLRFRCVSRSWKAMIDDPQFTRLHLNRFNNLHQSHLLFVQGRSCECLVKNNATLRTSFRLGFLQSDDLGSVHVLRTKPARGGDFKRWSVVSSIDGMLMLNCKNSSDLMLWNPSIRKTLVLPPSPEISGEMKALNFGFGFDLSTRDYKVVRFVLIPENGVQFVAVYTLGTNSWKKVEFRGEFRRDFDFSYYGQRSISFNGALYDLAADYLSRVKLVSFDLSTEVCASTELPVVDGPTRVDTFKQALTMVDDGSSLGLVNLSRPEGSIWALTRLGDDMKTWSWIQLYTFATVIPDYAPNVWKLNFLWLKKNGEMLLKWDKVVICYNLETRQEKILLEKNKKKLHEKNTFAYIESLILH